MKLLLVQPPRPLTESYKFAPLSLGYLASSLKVSNYEYEIIDLDAEDADVSVFPKRFVNKSFDYDIVGITCATVSYPAALKVASYVKGLNPSTLVVIGGPHVSFLANEVLHESKDIDIVVRGEGEQTLVEITYAHEHGLNFDNILGITYRQNSNIIENSDRILQKNLDSIPPPDWTKFPMDLYFSPPIITSRGCTRRCIYCAATSIHSFYRRRSIDSILSEIEDIMFFIERTPNRYLTFFDNTFVGDYDYSFQLLQELKRAKLNVKWTAELRVDNIDEDIIKLMKECGCIHIHYGIESGSQRILDHIAKNISIVNASKVVETTLNNGIGVACSFTIGHPEDTFETIKETEEKIKEFQLIGAHCSTSIVTPLPGTELWYNADEYGLKIYDVPWEKYTFYNPVMDTKYLNRSDIGRAYTELLAVTHAYTKIDDLKKAMEKIRNFRRSLDGNAI